MKKSGIDISRWQSYPDFTKVKKDGKVDFVIVQVGYGKYSYQKDPSFDYNYKNCKENGIPIGGYWFSYANTPEEAREEAKACLELIKGKQFEYPIYYDIEGSACTGDVYGKCRAFCEELEKSKYFAGIYISRSPAQQFLPADVGDKFALWLAEYGGRLNWGGSVGMWQNSSTGRFGGISGDVDTDICYVDYTALIKQGGYNGYKAEPAKPLDTEIWWRKGDKDHGIYAVKQRMRAIGYTKLDESGGFGGGTENAVKALQEQWGYKPTGEIGENFVKKVMK